jgi:hypothetical protein
VGTGHSSGAGAAEIHAPDEFILGWRTGPAEPRLCAIERETRRSRWLAPLLFVLGSIAIVVAVHGSP